MPSNSICRPSFFMSVESNGNGTVEHPLRVKWGDIQKLQEPHDVSLVVQRSGRCGSDVCRFSEHLARDRRVYSVTYCDIFMVPSGATCRQDTELSQYNVPMLSERVTPDEAAQMYQSINCEDNNAFCDALCLQCRSAHYKLMLALPAVSVA